VRKVLAVLLAKGIPFEIDPIVPFMGGRRRTLAADGCVDRPRPGVTAFRRAETLRGLHARDADPRDARRLAAIGAPILCETYGTTGLRRGVMPI